jgi:peroxiredoxin
MKRLAETYGPKGVVWLEINSTHTFSVAGNKAWREKHKLPFAILDDHAGKVGQAYDAKTTPDVRVIGRDGAVVYRGAIDDDPQAKAEKPANYVAQALEELLAGKEVSTPLTQPYGCTVKYAP